MIADKLSLRYRYLIMIKRLPRTTITKSISSVTEQLDHNQATQNLQYDLENAKPDKQPHKKKTKKKTMPARFEIQK